MHPLRKDEDGLASSMVAFLVAGVLFVGSIGAVMLATRQGGTGAAAATAPEANLEVQAESLAQVLLFSPGFTTTHEDWVAGFDPVAGTSTKADQIGRLGLQQTGDDPLLMNFSKFQNLRMAPKDAAVDGYVNYPEAREGFGLDKAGLDFHVRAFPTLPKVAELLKQGYKDPNLRVAYIGDITEAGGGGTDPALGLGVGPITCTSDAALHPRAFRVSALLTNGGLAPTQLEAIFEVTLPNGDSEYHKKNTAMLSIGGATDIFADVAATSGRSCAGAQVNLRVYDSGGLLFEASATMTEPAVPPAAAPRAIVLETSSESYAPTEAVSVSYGGAGLEEGNKLVLTVCPGVTECRLGLDLTGTRVDITVPKKENDRAYSFLPAAFLAGEYTIRLYDNTADPDYAIEVDAFRAQNRLLVVTPDPGPFMPLVPPPPGLGYLAGPAATSEVAMLDAVVSNFCPTWFDSSTGSPIVGWGTWAARCQTSKTGQPHPGDVYPQLKKALKDKLSERLMTGASCSGTPRYDWTNVLIVGSNVDHNVMTSGDVKHCIEAWVLGGGTLIVFGSADMNTHWLESVFQTALESSSGGLSVPDVGHPALHVADDLDYTTYAHERAWRLKTTGAFDAEAAFTRVANDATNGDAVLAVGDPGAFQRGNVILAGWKPYDLRGNGPGVDDEEARKFVNNILMLAYRDLYLDYGPPLPPDANVQPSISRVHINHPQFEEPILLNLAVYVFAGSKS